MNRLHPARPILAAVLAAVLLLPTSVGAGGTNAKRAPVNAGSPRVGVVVGATVETDPVPHEGDAADDPAIWIHPTAPSLSTIIATDKRGGLAVYDLSGKQLQYVSDGRMNNVDLRHDFPLDGQAIALVVASKPTDKSMAIYRVNPTTRRLEAVAGSPLGTGTAVLGLCMYRSRSTGTYYVFTTSGEGEVEQWELFDAGSGRIDARQVRTLSLGSEAEGCVADDELGHLYLAEEELGIWKYGAEPNAGAIRTPVDSTGAGGHLAADVEGLTIYQAGGGTGYLIASNQGSNTFVVYRREANNAYVGTFVIGAGHGIDAVEGTDGIDVTSAPLGPAFPQGLFVAQDGVNDRGNQNFKLVPWEAIANAVGPRRASDASRSVRQGRH
jgi:3-phytase